MRYRRDGSWCDACLSEYGTYYQLLSVHTFKLRLKSRNLILHRKCAGWLKTVVARRKRVVVLVNFAVAV